VTPRHAWGKTACGGGIMALLALAACSTILGIDKGLPLEDGGALDEASTAGESGVAACDVGAADPFACNGRCGSVTDNCGNEVDCATTCAGNLVCNPTKHLCECEATDWCHGRCGNSIDYCGVEQTCTCPTGSVCNQLSGLCGNCIPNPLACNGKTCGYADDGCAKQTCGDHGGGCAAGDSCHYDPGATAGTCCTPKSGADLCVGKCAGTVTDPCTGQKTDCSTLNTCTTNTEQCQNNTCCLVNGQPCDARAGGTPCCSGHCAAPVDAGDGAVTPQVCAP